MDKVFQSPSGVLGVCRKETQVLNPNHSEAFQSPSGVLGVCRIRQLDRLVLKARDKFQSPSGVLGVCRVKVNPDKKSAWVQFQSPSGVLGVCRAERS